MWSIVCAELDWRFLFSIVTALGSISQRSVKLGANSCHMSISTPLRNGPAGLSVAARQAAPLELSSAVVPVFQSIQDRNIGKLINSMARRDSKWIELERILKKESR